MSIEDRNGKLFLDGEEYKACPVCKMAMPKKQKYCSETCKNRRKSANSANSDEETLNKMWNG